MATRYGLPLLPGTAPNPHVGRTNFSKSQTLVFANKLPHTLPDIAPNGSDPSKTGTKGKATTKGGVPAWLAFDKLSLCFNCYFQEPLFESSREQYRVRFCKLFIFLEDDTLQISEASQENSGLPQGVILKRHRVPKTGDEEQYYTAEDFNVGDVVTIYGRSYKIYDCDKFTRNYLSQAGVHVPEAEVPPADPYMNTTQEKKAQVLARRPYEKVDKLKQFLENDRKVLRFYSVWDETGGNFNERRFMVLLYFLSDDSVEIREVLQPNSGRDGPAVFLRKQKLPKREVKLVKLPGESTPRTVLNVFGGSLRGGHHILDGLRTGSKEEPYYTALDFQIGATVSALGRDFLICDCDEFTKTYMRDNYGITEFTPIDLGEGSPQATSADAVNTNTNTTAAPSELPPHIGFGTEEDSAVSCFSLTPKRPKAYRGPHSEFSKNGLENVSLRFQAKWLTENLNDQERVFLVSFYPSNDSISVYEIPRHNSGMPAGKFLDRRQVKDTAGKLLSLDAFYVGAKVEILGRVYEIIDADEFTYNFMESKKFPVADFEAIASKLRIYSELKDDLQAKLVAADPDQSGACSAEDFRKIVAEFAQGSLNTHEVITLNRLYTPSDSSNDDAAAEELAEQLQASLTKRNFDRFKTMQKAFLHYDKDRTGNLTRDQLKDICYEFNVPVTDDILDKAMKKMPRTTSGHIDYKDFVKSLDMRNSEVVARKSQTTSLDSSLSRSLHFQLSSDRLAPVNQVLYEDFLRDVFEY